MKKNDISKRIQYMFTKAGKLKYAACILLIGILLMVYPQKKTEQPAKEQPQADIVDLEEELEDILSKIEGTGEVEVLLAFEEGTAYYYQSDEHIETDDKGESSEQQTVLVSDNSGNESPILVRTKYPVYKGAVVLCQGADKAVIRLSIVNAVSDLTGLGSDKISVIKMKGN